MYLLKTKGIKLPDDTVEAQNEKGGVEEHHNNMATWSGLVLRGLKKWFSMCWGVREGRAQRTFTAEDDDEGEEDMKPLVEGRRMKFPRHAASSFLRTGTSRIMREANNIL